MVVKEVERSDEFGYDLNFSKGKFLRSGVILLLFGCDGVFEVLLGDVVFE